MTDFWTKRKAAVEAEAETALEEAKIEQVEADAAEKTDEEVLEELGLPDPDTMEEGDDFKSFMSGAVPERLKMRALRRLWRLNPILANVDGLVDYGEDFTDAATVIEGMQTTYQVGKGMLAHVQEMARQAEERTASEAEAMDADEELVEPEIEDAALDPVDAQEILAEVEATETIAVQAEPTEHLAQVEEHDEIVLHPTRRRMQFQFDERQPA